VLNTLCGKDMRCTESILVGRKHMVAVDGGEFKCCSIASCIGYFDYSVHCYIPYCAVPTLLYHSMCRSTAQRTVYLHCQELSVIDGQFCR